MFDIFKPQEQDAQLAELTEGAVGGAYIPELKLQYGVSKAVGNGKATVGDYMIGDLNLGKEVTIFVGPFRAHASVWVDKKKTAESFDAKSDTFQEIKARAKNFEKGCQAGPEYLVWVPEANKFALLPCVRTNLGAAVDLQGYQGGAVTLTSKIVNGKNNTYPVYDFKPAGDVDNLAKPSADAAQEAEELFTRPLKTVKAAVSER